MGTLKKPKPQRNDQPTMFDAIGDRAQPVVIHAAREETIRVATIETKVCGNSDRESDARPDPIDDEDRQNTSSFRRIRKPSISELHGRWMPVYEVQRVGDVVEINDSESMCSAGLYVSHQLLFAVVVAPWWFAEPSILCRFPWAEWPAVTRECDQLTDELLDTIRGKCVQAELAWEQGNLPNAHYETMRERMAAIERAARAPHG